MTFPTTNDPQTTGLGPMPQFAVVPSFVFGSSPPSYPTIPPVKNQGFGPYNVDPNAGVPA